MVISFPCCWSTGMVDLMIWIWLVVRDIVVRGGAIAMIWFKMLTSPCRSCYIRRVACVYSVFPPRKCKLLLPLVLNQLLMSLKKAGSTSWSSTMMEPSKPADSGPKDQACGFSTDRLNSQNNLPKFRIALYIVL